MLCCALIGAGGACVCAAQGADDKLNPLTLIDRGASAKIGYYLPQRIALTAERPAFVTKLPAEVAELEVANLKFAELSTAGKSVWMALLEGATGESKLWVDANRDGDLSNDEPADWAEKTQSQQGQTMTMRAGGAMLALGTAEKPFKGYVIIYRFDPNDPARAAVKGFIFAHRDYALEGEISLGDKAYKALVVDDGMVGDLRGKPDSPEAAAERTKRLGAPPPFSGVNVLLDINANGSFERKGESFDIRMPFKVGGAVYEFSDVSPDGSSLKVIKSDKDAVEIVPPPDHAVGKRITPFEAKTMDGKTLKFPEDYKGKVVLLDFWATWCGPCIVEMPVVVAAHTKYHDRGFEVLGISLDREKSEDKIKQMETSKGMRWPQVYDGGFWKARIAELYAVQSIPATYLVDGDSGLILGIGLRGAKLGSAIEEALAKKRTP